MENIVKKVIELMTVQTQKPAVRFVMERNHTGIFDSKIGGKAYLPADAEYPYDRAIGCEKNPLVLLAQINLDRLPPYKDYPQKGMLQFFITANDDYGIDWNDHASSISSRVLYYSDIIYDESKLKEPPEIAYDEEHVPFQHELSIHFQSCQVPINSLSDYIGDAYAKALETLGVEPSDVTNEQETEILNAFGYSFTGLCDNLNYCQGDPTPEVYTELLIQIDSDCDGELEIMWKDAGTAHFFIEPKKLTSRDFTTTYYQYDCG